MQFDGFAKVQLVEFFLQLVEQSGVMILLKFNCSNFSFNQLNMQKKGSSKVWLIQLFVQPIEHGRKLNMVEGSTELAYSLTGWK